MGTARTEKGEGMSQTIYLVAQSGWDMYVPKAAFTNEQEARDYILRLSARDYHGLTLDEIELDPEGPTEDTRREVKP
jgi:hypothetical protein